MLPATEPQCRCAVICIGGEPRSGWAAETGVRTDRAGYILTGLDLLDVGQRPENWLLELNPLALERACPASSLRRRTQVPSESRGLLLLVHSGRLTAELRDARNQAKAAPAS